MDPMTMLAFANFFSKAAGQKQVGPAAPAYTPGQPAPLVSGIQAAQQSGGGLLDALATANQQVEATDAEAPVTSKPSVFNTEEQNAAMKKPWYEGFLGGIDKGLQSPSQLLGLGLLSQLTNQHPAAGLGGLLAMGLYNRNR